MVKDLIGKESHNGKSSAKNIRRRIYDAINVLEAMGVVSKDKKQISWLGLPSDSQQNVAELQKDRDRCLKEVERKRKHLSSLQQKGSDYSCIST
mmetsp:Transcript_20765/g.29154  ORF Transcript_20765/g.29154 Transcript_20765/m.29154 type:complete len:94 (+) Transcript_20765:281-562(+)